ncbi:MAG: ATP-binding protein [Ardenticatenaceae bacterium]
MSKELSEMGLEVEYLPIRVNEKILLNIGGGVYSSPAGAIKELVNNAFDADAEQVVISTGYPFFDEIQVMDTGQGMSLERFKMAMVSIGNSMKDTIDPYRVTQKYKRPIIGRLGIGLMALSQVCDKAMIESRLPEAKTKFLALIDFTQFRPNRYERTSLSVLSSQFGGAEAIRHQLAEEGLEPERREELKLRLKLALEADKMRQLKEIDLQKQHLGYCMYIPELPVVLPHVHGTTITLLGIRPEIRQMLSDSSRPLPPPKHVLTPSEEESEECEDWEDYMSLVQDYSWRDLCERLRIDTELTYQTLPSYHQFLYELAFMSPVPYFDDAPITMRPEILQQKKKELRRFNFSLRVDNRLLYKPQLLPSGALSPSADEVIIRPLYFDDYIDGSQLRYTGYLYWQNSQNKPSAIRGIQLYIRNVGIALYDQTLLNFSKVDSSLKVRHISGEIYVEKGLERALKVDRESFRETDAHYVVLQHQIWKELRSISSRVTKAEERRKQAQFATEQEEHVTTLEKMVTSATNGARIQAGFARSRGLQPLWGAHT